MWDVRPITESEADLFLARLYSAFGGDPDSDDGARERFLELFELERTVAVFEGQDIVGTGGAFSLGLTVPGGATVPMAGTTIITVQPTHTRRGILREMMAHHLDEVATRGEPLAGLWASESSIYGRFGFGPATYMHETKLDARTVTIPGPEPPGGVRLLDADKAEPLLRAVYDRARTEIPGMFTRSDRWWRLRRMRDLESDRRGKSARRYAIYEEDGSALGYATYRQKQEWEDFPEGEIHIIELIALTPEAHMGLWAFLTNIDLFPKVGYRHAPLDDPLSLQVSDQRRVRRHLSDALWIRLVDIPEALESRSYERDGRMVMRVEDDFRPANGGVYALEVVGGRGSCERVDADPDITCDVDILGHLYLGGGTALGMARAGRVHGAADAVRDLHRMFRTDAAPWCPEVF